MPQCANKNCGVTCPMRYCQNCYLEHKQKLTNRCVTCDIPVLETRRYCKQHNPVVKEDELHPCKRCGQSCRRTYCTDCMTLPKISTLSLTEKVHENEEEQKAKSSVAVYDRKCETCDNITPHRFCMDCRNAYLHEQRPCKDCGEMQTNGSFCAKCVIAYKATLAQCKDCTRPAIPRQSYCRQCITTFKTNLQPCMTCSKTTAGRYCEDCRAAYKSKKQSEDE